MSALKDITGQRFGRLTVIKRTSNDAGGRAMWLCECDCGNETIVHGRHLRDGATQSCGCLNRERIIKHGGSSERLYTIWSDMRQRCYSHNEPSYIHYGARGIKVCPAWDDYATFRAWALLNGYDPHAAKGKCTLDRIDVNGDYEPSNCRWVDMNVQCNNRRVCHYLTINGITHTLSEWSKITGVNHETIRGRIARGAPPFVKAIRGDHEYGAKAI